MSRTDAGPAIMPRAWWRSLAVLPLMVAPWADAGAQPQPIPSAMTAPALAPLPSSQAGTPTLTAGQLESLLEPFAGAPQDVLAVVLDACRYPTELVAATQWATKPADERGPAPQAWPPPVRLLAERAPRTLQYLTQDIASTAVLGAAFQNQPNDVWLAFGRVTLAAQAKAEQQATPAEAGLPNPPSQPPPAVPARDSARPTAAAPPARPPAAEPVQAVPVPTEAPPVVVQAPPGSVVTTQPAAPVTVVTTPAPVATVDPVGSALVGGIVGLGAGLLIAELVHDDDHWGAPGYGHGYRPPYAVPPPYAPYGGARTDAARVMQEDRQAAARVRQEDRQASLDGRQQDRQANAADRRDSAGERSDQRSATRDDRQGGRQESGAARQATRDDRQGGRQEGRPDRQQQPGDAGRPRAEQRSAAGGAGPDRRASATAGQQRADLGARERPAAAQSRPSPQAARGADWGPARGMSGGAEVSRSRAPSGGFSAGARGGGGGGGGGRAAAARGGGGGGGGGGRRR
jgi:uncharacterized membrane protein YgcG